MLLAERVTLAFLESCSSFCHLPQNLKKDVAAAQPEMQKLNKELEMTEKLCSSLQQGYQEYCPDIRRQETQVKSLQNRYANLNNQLVDRYDVATNQ